MWHCEFLVICVLKKDMIFVSIENGGKGGEVYSCDNVALSDFFKMLIFLPCKIREATLLQLGKIREGYFIAAR